MSGPPSPCRPGKWDSGCRAGRRAACGAPSVLSRPWQSGTPGHGKAVPSKDQGLIQDEDVEGDQEDHRRREYLMDLVREHFPEPTHLVPPLPVGPTLTCVPAFYSCRT